MASVEERVKQIIVEQLGVDEAEVTPTASFVDDLGADSLDQVELVMADHRQRRCRIYRQTRQREVKPLGKTTSLGSRNR